MVWKIITPRPNRGASQRKFRKENVRRQTSDGWSNRLASGRKFHTSCKKAISVQPCARRRINENNTLKQLTSTGQKVRTYVRSAANMTLIKVNTSHGKYTQVMAK